MIQQCPRCYTLFLPVTTVEAACFNEPTKKRFMRRRGISDRCDECVIDEMFATESQNCLRRTDNNIPMLMKAAFNDFGLTIKDISENRSLSREFAP
jgi:hypothetical protein